MSLYEEIKASGIPFGNHESDLYFRDCPESRAILAKYPLQKGNAERFTNQAHPNKGERWVDVPFAYQPFWDSRKRKTKGNMKKFYWSVGSPHVCLQHGEIESVLPPMVANLPISERTKEFLAADQASDECLEYSFHIGESHTCGCYRKANE